MNWLSKEVGFALPAVDENVSFVDFCAGLGVRLYPAQRVLAAVAFDGVEPCAMKPRDRDIARQVFGDVDRIPAAARRVVTIVAGARAGKSYVCSGLRLLWGALTRDLSTLAPGQKAVGLVVAPDMRLGREVISYALGAALSDPEIAALLVGDYVDRAKCDSFLLRRPDGNEVRLEALPATKGGRATRGRSLTDAVLDEAAFFEGEDYKVNDAEIFQSVSPRVLAGGQVMVPSTPWAQSGLLYENWKRNHGHPIDSLVAHAPSLLMRPDPALEAVVRALEETDPDNARREYGAEFMRSGTDQFFDGALLEACVDDSLRLDVSPRVGDVVSSGGDFGFRSDSSALAIVHRDGVKMHLAMLRELRPENGTPLRPSEVVADFAVTLKSHGATFLVADQHYRETIVEHLGAKKIGFIDAPSQPAEAFVKARQLMREGRVRIPNHARFLRQLREVKGRALPGGRLAIEQPRRPGGGHGDLVSAFVLAIWAAGGDTVAAAVPERGTREHDRYREERRVEHRREVVRRSVEDPWWKRKRN